MNKKKTTDSLGIFQSILDELDDPNTHIADEATSSAEFSGWIDTGSHILNAALSGSLWGGIPNNKVTALAGEEATGKTFYLLAVLKHFLEQHPQAAAFYYDTEGAVTKKMMVEHGIDAKRVIIVEPETIQSFRTHAVRVLDNYAKVPEEDRPPLIFALDSLGALSTTKEVEDTGEGKETRDMTKAQLIKATFRVLTLKLAKLKVPMLVTNHVYNIIGTYVPTKEMGGGAGLKYAASTILFLSKSKDRDKDKNIVGVIITCTMKKSRFTKEGVRVKTRLSFQKGLDRYYGLQELGEAAGLIKKEGNRFVFPNGEKGFTKDIDADPERFFTKDVLDKLEEVVKAAFCFGQSEEVRGITQESVEE